GSMRTTIEETERRRTIQEEYNRVNGIAPQTIISAIKHSMDDHLQATGYRRDESMDELLSLAEELPAFSSLGELTREVKKLEKEMHQAAGELAFERAAQLRDRIKKIRMLEIELG
ncbi:MAG TPA: UvrB/UvrC motif-containing protein, partial [Desulforhopalus sp.]|nr:UvrB/UvrC motif-containing protein [Desulforhopalus sp.]